MLARKIKILEEVGSLTKKERITNVVVELIRSKELKHGDNLPSVNELSKQLGYARETVVKAYALLKQRGLINSKQGLGYFVSSNESEQILNIALVMYAFQTFQQTFYNTIRQELGELYNIDVYFHLNNERMYENIINTVKGKYGLYIIAPIQSEKSAMLLDSMDENQVLLVDRSLTMPNVASITQEFENSLTGVFGQLLDRFKKYKKTILFYREDKDYPEEIEQAFIQFFTKHKLPFEIQKEFHASSLNKGSAYFTISDIDLWKLLKETKNRNFKVGKDIGILSHNDTPVKEIIEDGITTYTTDFEAMALEAVTFIKGRKRISMVIPSVLKERNSL